MKNCCQTEVNQIDGRLASNFIFAVVSGHEISLTSLQSASHAEQN